MSLAYVMYAGGRVGRGGGSVSKHVTVKCHYKVFVLVRGLPSLVQEGLVHKKVINNK
jgi:hypothetical protein